MLPFPQEGRRNYQTCYNANTFPFRLQKYKKIYTSVTLCNIFCREVGRREGNSLYSTVNREFIVSILRVIMNWGLGVGMRHGLEKSR